MTQQPSIAALAACLLFAGMLAPALAFNNNDENWTMQFLGVVHEVSYVDGQAHHEYVFRYELDSAGASVYYAVVGAKGCKTDDGESWALLPLAPWPLLSHLAPCVPFNQTYVLRSTCTGWARLEVPT